ncbi:hypothetical protein Tco_0562203 [Tanacetum coccineum]
MDKMVAKRLQEEMELSEKQKKRKEQVQFEAQCYTKEGWDAIIAKIEANADLTKDMLGKNLLEEDFAKRIMELINKKKKYYAEQKAKAKRSKPVIQAQQRDYMSTFIKNQSSWKLTQLKKLTFEELKDEFEKLVKNIERFMPMESNERVKRQGVQLEHEFTKKQKIIEDAPKEKVKDVKEEEIEKPMKKKGKRRKQLARKGKQIDKTAQSGTEEREAYIKEKVTDPSSGSDIRIDAIPTATKPPSVVDWKIIPQPGQKAAYQIIRANGADKVYMSFRAILKDISRDDLIELYILVIKKYGANRPEEAYDRVLWDDLKTMFDPPLSEDTIWSLPLQQKMDACQAMLHMKLQGGAQDEVCYQLLKMIEKQAGLNNDQMVWKSGCCFTIHNPFPFIYPTTKLHQKVRVNPLRTLPQVLLEGMPDTSDTITYHAGNPTLPHWLLRRGNDLSAKKDGLKVGLESRV